MTLERSPLYLRQRRNAIGAVHRSTRENELKTYQQTFLALTVAAAALLGSLCPMVAAQDAPQTKKAGKKGNTVSITGKLSKLDAKAKTFTVSSKKKGDTEIVFDDKTVFKKGPAAEGDKPTEAKAEDLKDGERVGVRGTPDGTKIKAAGVMIGGMRKKKKQ